MKRKSWAPLFAEQFSTARYAALCLLSIALGGCSRFQILDSVIPSGGYHADVDLRYGIDPRQQLDVYRPQCATQPSPVVVFFYGGDWQTGAKEDYRFVAQALTGRGFVTVLPDYRLYPQVRFPAFVNDAAAAVKWVHDHIALFGGDPHRVYLLGHSAGAHIVALLALDTHYLKDVGLAPAAIRATAGLAGPYDFRPRQEEFAVFGMASPASPVPPDIEPIHFADHVAPPMLLIHGAEDDIVGPENAANLSRKLKDAGSTVVWLEYLHAGHGGLIQSFAWPFRWMNPALCDVTHFFQSH